MKIVSWNINGIRSKDKTLEEIFKVFDSDIVCFQETKINKIDLSSELAFVDGFNSYFNFPSHKSGYSGVATFCKNLFIPYSVEYDLSAAENNLNDVGIEKQVDLENRLSTVRRKELNSEGRCIITHHHITNCCKHLNEQSCKLSVINVYCPMANLDNEERMLFKLDFYKLLELKAKSLLSNGNHVIIVGDMNVSHKQIDHCEPDDLVVFQAHPSRKWLDNFLLDSNINEKELILDKSSKTNLFIDSFRFLHPKRKQAFTCWNTSVRARETNYGTRIDYIFIDLHLSSILYTADIMSDFYGSDHCPIFSTFRCKMISSKSLPSSCTKYFSNFSGKQQTLQHFVCKENNFFTANCLQQKKQTNVNRQKKLTDFYRNEFQLTNSNSAKSYPQKRSSKLLDLVEVKKPATSCNVDKWKSLFTPQNLPMCNHNEPTVIRRVKKSGKNFGKAFYACARPVGHSTNKEANCNFFQWKSSQNK